MKNLLKISTFILSYGAAVNIAAADSSYTGKIEKIHTSTSIGSIVLLILSEDQYNKAGCANNATYDYAFDASSTTGKAMLSISLAAFATGKDVYVGGGGADCTHLSNVEDLRWLRIQ